MREAVLDRTQSVCPECHDIIPAKLVERDGKIVMVKSCKRHGDFEEVCYHSDFYKRIMRYWKYVDDPRCVKRCPHGCEGCREHKSETSLAIIDLTNKCNLNCAYCFATANTRRYEPSAEKIKEMISFLRKEQPRCNAILFSGGEPTLREDLFEILDHARSERFDCLMIATNGIKIAGNPEYTMELARHGLGLLYLSFDGLDDETNPYKKSHCYIDRIIENCRPANIGIILVPTTSSVNAHQIWQIIHFAAQHTDVVKCVNFQPIGFSGRASHEATPRYTIPDLCKDLERQSGGVIKVSDFYPVNAAVPLTRLLEEISGERVINFSMHPMCGMATYLYVEDGKILTISDFIDVDKFLGLCERYTEKFRHMKGFSKGILTLQFITELNGAIREKSRARVMQLLANIILKRNYAALEKFHQHALFIGAMHFQDCYNLDLKRLQRCGVHFITPSFEIIPFCAYNNLGYRERIESAHGAPAKSPSAVPAPTAEV